MKVLRLTSFLENRENLEISNNLTAEGIVEELSIISEMS